MDPVGSGWWSSSSVPSRLRSGVCVAKASRLVSPNNPPNTALLCRFWLMHFSHDEFRKVCFWRRRSSGEYEAARCEEVDAECEKGVPTSEEKPDVIPVQKSYTLPLQNVDSKASIQYIDDDEKGEELEPSSKRTTLSSNSMRTRSLPRGSRPKYKAPDPPSEILKNPVAEILKTN